LHVFQDLINLGAKKLVVPGNFPIGCVPLYLAIFQSQKEGYYEEQTGCIKWLNEFAEYHNRMLQEELEKLRNLHPDVTIIYADYYGAALNIFRAPLKFGEFHFQFKPTKTHYLHFFICRGLVQK
jgi:phospholipase/lecithinase/hemolysin